MNMDNVFRMVNPVLHRNMCIFKATVFIKRAKYVTEIPPVSPGIPSVSPRPLSGIPHPVVGHASVGAWASCPLSHRTRVRTARRGPARRGPARRGCHSYDEICIKFRILLFTPHIQHVGC